MLICYFYSCYQVPAAQSLKPPVSLLTATTNIPLKPVNGT
jgi:hypothetical protein